MLSNTAIQLDGIGAAPCPCRHAAGMAGYGAMGRPAPARVVSIDAASVVEMTDGVASTASRTAMGQPVTTQIHLTDGGGRFATASHLSADGNVGAVHLQGSIGPIPFDLTLTVSLELAARSVSAALDIAQPFPFDHQWTYQLEGGHATPAGLAAISLAPAPSATLPAASSSLDWWCLAKCGGTTILGLLAGCLPSLAAGGSGYVACVTAQAGSAAAGIASCIADDCLG